MINFKVKLFIIFIINFFIINLFLFIKNNDFTNFYNILYYRNKSTLDEGYGMFAKKNIKKNDIIEECTFLRFEDYNVKSTRLKDYSWSYKKKNIIPLGYCSIINHSYNPNAKVVITNDFLSIIALTNIKKNEEIFISYGSKYWKSRKKKT